MAEIIRGPRQFLAVRVQIPRKPGRSAAVLFMPSAVALFMSYAPESAWNVPFEDSGEHLMLENSMLDMALGDQRRDAAQEAVRDFLLVDGRHVE